jgi:hypothetical protein
MSPSEVLIKTTVFSLPQGAVQAKRRKTNDSARNLLKTMFMKLKIG